MDKTVESLPVYLPKKFVCRMSQYGCCKRHQECRLYPICSKISKQTVCKQDCPNCNYEGCSLGIEQRQTNPLYIDHVIQTEKVDLNLEMVYSRERAVHKKQHQELYAYYNTVFADYRERRNAAQRERYWADPEYSRMRAREYYSRSYEKHPKAIDKRFLPECGLQCFECRHEDCILPPDWLKKAHNEDFKKNHPDYFTQYRATHREERSAYGKRRYVANKETVLQQIREHRQKPEVKAQRAKYDAAYRKANPERDREKHKRYYARHKDEINAKKRAKRAERRKNDEFERCTNNTANCQV